MHGHTPFSNANNFRGELKVNGQKTKVESQSLEVK